MTKDEELQNAYNDLEAAEHNIGRLRKQVAELERMKEVIVAAGLLSEEKFEQARELVRTFDDTN